MAIIVAVVSSFLLMGNLAPQTASAQPAPTVVLVPQGDLGMVLADPDGWTLYTWDGDQEGVSNCYDACAADWPPYSITGDLIAPDDLPASLGLIDRGDGSWQVTVDNWPLYYYAYDNQPGDINGNGDPGFGATWWIMAYSPPAPDVVVVVPQPALPAPAQPAPFQPAPIVTSPPIAAIPPVVARQTVQVAINNFDFRPATVNIQVGDTVNWMNNGPVAHTATSDNGAFDSGRLNPGQSYSHTFTTPGSYPYHCALHSNMRGIVIVGGTGAGPVVGGQQPFTPNFGPPAYDQGPFYGNQPFPGGYQGYPGGQPYPYDPNPYDNFPPGVIPPVGGQVPPGFGTLVNATVPTNGTVAVNWLPIQNAISYNVYTTSAATPLNLQMTSRVSQSLGGAPVTQTVLAGLTPGQSYLIQVRAADANGVETVVPIASPQGGPGGPTLPTGPLSVSSATANSVALTWTGLPGASSYRVLQGSSAAGPFVVSTGGTTTTTSATVTGLSPNTTYFFQVVPVDQLGNQGPPTNVVSASTNLTLPAPGNLSLVTATGSMAVLSWGASPGATAYRVLQSQLPGGPFVVVNPASLTTSGATIVNLTPNTTYYYQVVALDASGNQSVASNTITVVTGAP